MVRAYYLQLLTRAYIFSISSYSKSPYFAIYLVASFWYILVFIKHAKSTVPKPGVAIFAIKTVIIYSKFSRPRTGNVRFLILPLNFCEKFHDIGVPDDYELYEGSSELNFICYMFYDFYGVASVSIASILGVFSSISGVSFCVFLDSIISYCIRSLIISSYN